MSNSGPDSFDFRSLCPLASALDIVGDKWTLVILRDLFFGKQRFSEFLASPEGVSPRLLSQRLSFLEAQGLVRKISTAGTHPLY
jgi:DNA-binding HxlR family transcriptional regulator